MSERNSKSTVQRQSISKRKTTVTAHTTTHTTTATTTTNDNSTDSNKSETLSIQEMQQTDCDIPRDQFRTTIHRHDDNNKSSDITEDDTGKGDDIVDVNYEPEPNCNDKDMIHEDEESTDDDNSEVDGDCEGAVDSATGSHSFHIRKSHNDGHKDDDTSLLMDAREEPEPEFNNDENIDTKSKNESDNNDSFMDETGNGPNKRKCKSETDSARTNNGNNNVNSDQFTCPVCSLKLDSQHTFTLHIRQHNPSDHSHTCRLCGKTLSSASSLDRHMLIHSGERPFKCRICNMAFTTNGNMHRHMRTHGMELNEDYNANSDGNNNNKLKSKKRKSSEDVSSSIHDHGTNDMISPKRRNSEGDESVVSDVNIIKETSTECFCPVCNKPFPSKSALHSHMESHPNDPIYCRDCGMILNNYATYTQHRCTAATDPTTGFYKMNFSTAPSFGFFDLSFSDFTSTKFSMIAKSFCEHNFRKGNSSYHDFECDKCHRAFPCGSALNLHQSSHNGDTYCGLCHCDFPTPAMFLSHQIKHRFTEFPMYGRSIPPPHGFVPPANECALNGLSNAYGDVPQSEKDDFLALLNLQNKGNQSFNLQQNYKFIRHEDTFDNPSYFVHAKPIPPQPTTFQPKIITNGTDVESGKHDLADIQSIISVTSTATPLISSIRSSPPAASPASPVQFGISGKKPDSPVPAESANASPNTPSVNKSINNNCEAIDDKQVNDQPSGEENVLPSDGDANVDKTSTLLKCTRCNLKFKSSNALKRHNRGHIQGGHSYACHLCPYTSLDKSTLVRHLRTHNGERPFQCAICKYAFTTKANCERHVKKRHKKLNKQEIRNAMQYNPNMSTSSTTALCNQNLTKSDSNLSLSPSSDSFPGGFDTVCKYCNVDFKFNRVLRHHLRSLHNSCSRKPYCCTLCKLGFSTKNNCIRHVMKQHPDMKDKLSNVVLSNATSLASNSDHSESESMHRDSPGVNALPHESLNFSSDHSFKSDSYTPDSQLPSQHSSLAALCQIARNISVPNETPINLAIGGNSKSSSDAGPKNNRSFEDQPLNLANHSSEEQPLDLAVHALDLSCKSSNIRKDRIFNDDAAKQVTSDAVRSAASSLLALRSMATNSAFPSGALLAGTSLFNPNVSLTPPLPAHSSASMSMLSPVSNTSMEDIYKAAATFRIAKNRLMPRNERSFTCIYCSAGFTLKSNMERHIKRKHPEFARPPRSRGHSSSVTSQESSHVNSTSLLSRTNSNATLSSKTRAALRVVLSNKVMATSGAANYNSRPSTPMISSSNNHDNIRVCEDGGDGNGGDLASVSSLIDHTANSSNALKQYFGNKSNDDADSNIGENNAEENNKNLSQSQSLRPIDAIKSHDKSRKRGKDNNTKVNDNNKSVNIVTKKRSAYTDSPNSVSCPYCSRKFPWTSSLRRHILTHTGLKPYKCPKCPILFTTKSNCERHLVRKHNGKDKRNIVEAPSAVPNAQDNGKYKCNICSNSTFSTRGNLRKHHYLRHWSKTGKYSNHMMKNKKSDKRGDGPHETIQNIPNDDIEHETNKRLNFKCYLCAMSFTDRQKCLTHLQSLHSNEYHVLLSKGAVDKVPTPDTKLSLDAHGECDHESQDKIFCVFCPRQFLSMENLRRHMRVHLGERPFKCTLCTKRFSLKNSLLRHYRTNHPDVNIPKGKSKLHNNQPLLKSLETESQLHCKSSKSKGSCNSLLYLMPKDNIAAESNADAHETDISDNDNTGGSDLIQNLLGIQDSKMLDEMLNSADSAARLLGVKDAL